MIHHFIPRGRNKFTEWISQGLILFKLLTSNHRTEIQILSNPTFTLDWIELVNILLKYFKMVYSLFWIKSKKCFLILRIFRDGKEKKFRSFAIEKTEILNILNFQTNFFINFLCFDRSLANFQSTNNQLIERIHEILFHKATFMGPLWDL